VTGGGTYDYGTVVTVVASPATGYHFVSWTGDVVDPNSATTTTTVTADKTVTASFAIQPAHADRGGDPGGRGTVTGAAPTTTERS